MGYDTRVPLDSETRDELRSLKQGNETYTDVVDRLLSDHIRIEIREDSVAFYDSWQRDKDSPRLVAESLDCGLEQLADEYRKLKQEANYYEGLEQ